jgi:hypothetical protein
MNKHLLERRRTLGQTTSGPNNASFFYENIIQEKETTLEKNMSKDNTREHYVRPRGQLTEREKTLKKNHQLNSRKGRKPLNKIINSTHGEGENPSEKKSSTQLTESRGVNEPSRARA